MEKQTIYLAVDQKEPVPFMKNIDIDGALLITNQNPSQFPEFEGLIVGYCPQNAPIQVRENTRSLQFILEDLEDISEKYLQLIYARCVKKPYVVAKTNRLCIREITLEDLPAMFELYESLCDDPYVEPLYEWDEELEFQKKYIENMYGFFQYGLWGLFELQTGKMIGRAGIEHREIDGETRQELGYLIGKAYQRQGYATEAAKAIIEYAREEIGLETLVLCAAQENRPSIYLANRLGFRLICENVNGMNLYEKKLKEG